MSERPIHREDLTLEGKVEHAAQDLLRIHQEQGRAPLTAEVVRVVKQYWGKGTASAEARVVTRYIELRDRARLS